MGSNDNVNRQIEAQLRQDMATHGIGGWLSITTFTDGRAPKIQCSTDPTSALGLIILLLQATTQALQVPPAQAQADPVFKKREYMGPRDGVKVYDKGEG